MADGNGARPRRVVTGVDFHDSSWAAAMWAVRSLAPDAEHALVHAIEPPELPGPLRGLTVEDPRTREAAVAAARRRLEELKAQVGGSAAVQVLVREGKPAREIVRLAEEFGAELIVTGDKGPTRGAAALLGSTAERVLIVAPAPVLIARRLPEGPPRRLLVAVDATPVARRVLEWAAALHGRTGAAVTVLTVVDRAMLGLRREEAEDDPSDSVAGERMREWLVEEARGAGLVDEGVEVAVLEGEAAEAIVTEAERSGADLVVIGSRAADVGRSPLLGRIVNKVVRSAPCSVLVVQPAAEARRAAG